MSDEEAKEAAGSINPPQNGEPDYKIAEVESPSTGS